MRTMSNKLDINPKYQDEYYDLIGRIMVKQGRLLNHMCLEAKYVFLGKEELDLINAATGINDIFNPLLSISGLEVVSVNKPNLLEVS